MTHGRRPVASAALVWIALLAAPSFGQTSPSRGEAGAPPTATFAGCPPDAYCETLPTDPPVPARGSRLDPCRSGSMCQLRGMCSLDDGVCVAAHDADCLASTVCKEEGACAAIAWHCAPRDDADCARSESCRSAGRCSVDREERRCVIRDIPAPERCEDSFECRHEGRCGTRDGACVAVSPGDCRQSGGCKQDDKCFLDEESGRCESTPRQRSGTAVLFGVGLAVTGAVSMLYGSAVLGAEPAPDADEEAKAIIGVTALGGGAVLAIGGGALALWGAQPVLDDHAGRTRLTIGWGGARLDGTF